MEKKMIKPTKRKLSRRYIEEFNLDEIEKVEFTSARMLKTLDSQTMAKSFMMISDELIRFNDTMKKRRKIRQIRSSPVPSPFFPPRR
jgi:hypothetical protein